jgi:hypothetical protein
MRQKLDNNHFCPTPWGRTNMRAPLRGAYFLSRPTAKTVERVISRQSPLEPTKQASEGKKFGSRAAVATPRKTTMGRTLTLSMQKEALGSFCVLRSGVAYRPLRPQRKEDASWPA